jgi:hypothetical protein
MHIFPLLQVLNGGSLHSISLGAQLKGQKARQCPFFSVTKIWIDLTSKMKQRKSNITIWIHYYIIQLDVLSIDLIWYNMIKDKKLKFWSDNLTWLTWQDMTWLTWQDTTWLTRWNALGGEWTSISIKAL